jgi:hypothetical protein
MARITRLTLDPIAVDVDNAIVDVHVDVTFSKFDKDANTPYTMICTLLGHDPFPPEAGEDTVDDVIPNGTLTPLGGQTIRADGLDVQTFDFNKTLGTDDLDEDFTVNQTDDIKAHVTLTPVVAHATEADSNIRRLTVTSS